jgi:hypothetical protein
MKKKIPFIPNHQILNQILLQNCSLSDSAKPSKKNNWLLNSDINCILKKHVSLINYSEKTKTFLCVPIKNDIFFMYERWCSLEMKSWMMNLLEIYTVWILPKISRGLDKTRPSSKPKKLVTFYLWSIPKDRARIKISFKLQSI